MAHPFEREVRAIEGQLHALVRRKGFRSELRQMLEYALDLPAGKKRSAKRLRPALLLCIAQAYGVARKCGNAALAIELFHAFTLVHDDIADRDEVRRNKPTLWKKWGMEKALNVGDMLLILAGERIAEEKDEKVRKVLSTAFAEVCRGQQLDFELVGTKLSRVREADYIAMSGKKTAALFCAAALVPAVSAKQDPRVRNLLRDFGYQFGLAYQMADDYRSVWSAKKETGKDAQSDLREKKRTLPVILAYHSSGPKSRKRLRELFEVPRQLSRKRVAEVLELFREAEVKKEIREKIRAVRERALQDLAELKIPMQQKKELAEIVRAATHV